MPASQKSLHIVEAWMIFAVCGCDAEKQAVSPSIGDRALRNPEGSPLLP